MSVPTAALPISNRLIFDGDSVCIGAVRCPPTAPDFDDECRSKCYSLAFSRSAVTIRPAGRRPFVEDSTVGSFYNQNQHYSRRLLAPEGDRCEWFGIAPSLVRDAIRPYDPAAADADHELFRFAVAKVPASLYFKQRTLVHVVRREPRIDPILIEETAIEILSLLVAVAYTGVDRVETMPTDCGRDLAEATKQVLAKRYLHPISLRLLAVEVGASVFHLCRTFRKFHGTTVHRYLVEMRLRRALEELARERTDLGGLAVALKFSHHSHFSAAFRSEFGVPPSVARSVLRGTNDGIPPRTVKPLRER
jgi:AraC-like DNA-binding protein